MELPVLPRDSYHSCGPDDVRDDRSPAPAWGESTSLLSCEEVGHEYNNGVGAEERVGDRAMLPQRNYGRIVPRLLMTIGLATSTALVFGVSDGMLTTASSALSSFRLELWYDGSDYEAANSKVQGRLWKVERTLVPKELCPPATSEVEKLRNQSWPRKNAGKAPRISEILYINLDWDIARNEFMQEQIRELKKSAWAKGSDFDWFRVPGVSAQAIKDGKACSDWMQNRGFSNATSPNVYHDWRTAGCACGHYHAIQRVPEISDDEVTVILEDDAEVVPDLFDAWEKLWPFVPEHWDVLRLGWFGDNQNCSQVVNKRVDRAGWQSPRQGNCAYCGAQAYIINPSSKDSVLERFRRSRITHADELLGAPTPELENPNLVPPLRSFVVWPMLAKTHVGPDGKPAFESDRVMGREKVQLG